MRNRILLIIIFQFCLYGQTKELIKKQIDDSGLSEKQVLDMIDDPNISREQIVPDDNDYEIDLSKDNLNDETIIKDIDTSNDEENANNDLNNKISENFVKEELEYYGYSIFKNDPTIFQSSSVGIVDPDYNIGPEDEIIIMLWGETQFRKKFTVDREGYVFLPDVGQVYVNGLNLKQLENKFFQILSKVYSTLNPSFGEPTTFIDISLGYLKPLRIMVLGDVQRPGAYSVSHSASLLTSLYYFQGPTVMGSLRDIQLIRKGKRIASIDFYEYLKAGYSSNDIRLQLDDIVFLPPRGKTVSIKGEIQKEGIYELKHNESLFDLINIAGGVKKTAYINRAQIKRIVSFNERDTVGMERALLDIDLRKVISNEEDIALFDGDTLFILKIDNQEKNYVTIKGSTVSRTGRYELIEGMRVLDLINLSDGLLKDAYLDLAHLIRNENKSDNKIININLNKVFNNDINHNLELEILDELIIYNENYLKNSKTNVMISGSIKNSGAYYLNDNQSLRDLIIRAGGFSENTLSVKITVARNNPNSFYPEIFNFPKDFISPSILIDDLDKEDSVLNQFSLVSNDIVIIYPNPKNKLDQMVTIDGYVYYPGNYPIMNKNETIYDIIKRSGGLLPEAYPKASTFKRGDNIIQVSYEKIIDNPKSKENFIILPGDQISIFRKPNIVSIEGEVHNPGLYKYYNNYTISDYIAIAGGYTVDAEKKSTWVSYPDGTSKKIKRMFPSPVVFDGSTINVNMKKEEDPIDKTEFAKEIASIIADFLQIYITLAILLQTIDDTNS